MPNLSNPLSVLGPLVILAGMIAGFFVWWKSRKKKPPADQAASAPPAAADGADPVRTLFQAAERRLKLSRTMKGARAASLPAIIIVGPKEAGKTSAVLNSGLDAELLAGQVHQGSEVVPTVLNIWLAHQVLLIEVSEALATNAQVFPKILKHLQTGRLRSAFSAAQPARAILLCADQKPLVDAATPDQIAAAARPWNQCLSLAVATLETQLPVYVLFTKLDGVPGFREFVSRLSAKDSAQVLGATIKTFNPAGPGAYAEETAQVVNRHFAQIVSSLCDSRTPILSRELDQSRIALEYQFPRDFQKLQKNLVAFLVEVAKPSQLQVSPFLRGFYFSGTRQVAAEPSAGQAMEPEPMRAGGLAATTLLSPEQLKAEMSRLSQPQAPLRSITEWLFIPKLFERVLLQDRAAHALSTTGSRPDRLRAVAFGALGVLSLLLLLALTVSYVRNRRLEIELLTGAAALEKPPGTDPFAAFEQMRRPIERLLVYQQHVSWTQFGLYRDDLLPEAQSVYCTAMRQKILQPVVAQMEKRLDSLPPASQNQSDDFNRLKAYLMVTANPEHADPNFLERQLLDYWKQTSTAAGIPASLGPQIRTYAELLLVPDSLKACVFRAPDGLIDKARQHFANPDIYASLLQQAGSGLPPVDYNEQFGNDAVSDAVRVGGEFTPAGWKKMHQLLASPEESLKADNWVLGQNEASTQQLNGQATDLEKRYQADYAKAWSSYLQGATISRYGSLADAAAKLEKISGQRRLLELLGLASENIGDDMKAFQPVRAAAPNSKDFPAAGDYTSQLNNLKNDLLQAANSASEADTQKVRDQATAARNAVDKLAQSFQGETSDVVKDILLKPILEIDPLLKKQSDEAVNGGGKNLCQAYNHLAQRLPFSQGPAEALPDDVQRVFQQSTGEMWKLHNDFLRDSLECIGTDCTLKANPKYHLAQGFVRFFNSLYRWSHLLYSGPDLLVRLRLRALPKNHLKQLELALGDRHVTLTAGSAQDISWDPRNPQQFQVTGSFESETVTLWGPFRGPWEPFSWLFDADPKASVEGFTWIPRSGTTHETLLKNGQPEEYTLQVQSLDGTYLNRRNLSPPGCVVPLAK